MNSYFDLVKHLFDDIHLDKDDERFAITIPYYPGQYPILPVFMGHRYTVWPSTVDKSCVALGFTLEANEKERFVEIENDNVVHRFEQWKRFVFESDDLELPYYIRVKDMNILLERKDLQSAWVRSAIAGMQRVRIRSMHRYQHQPIVYKTIIDLDYRKRILDKAFPDSKAA